MTKNDKKLLCQMIAAGKFNQEIYELLCKYNEERSKALVRTMGAKWCMHPIHSPKSLKAQSA